MNQTVQSNSTLAISSLAALLSLTAALPTQAQVVSRVEPPQQTQKIVCLAGKVPGYVGSGCVDDTQLTGDRKNLSDVKGAKREPVATMVGRGVPTVNINTSKGTSNL